MYIAIGKAICGWVQSSIYLNHIGGKMGRYRDRIECGRSWVRVAIASNQRLFLRKAGSINEYEYLAEYQDNVFKCSRMSTSRMSTSIMPTSQTFQWVSTIQIHNICSQIVEMQIAPVI